MRSIWIAGALLAAGCSDKEETRAPNDDPTPADEVCPEDPDAQLGGELPTDCPDYWVCTDGVNGKVCEETSCIIDGVCYPSGAQSDDGCCTCENAEYSCREEVGCRDWRTISKRCTGSDECGFGLECRTDFQGGQGVCTRPCNYGCPTDTACTYVRDSSGDFLDEEVCLRPCELARLSDPPPTRVKDLPDPGD